MILSLLALLLTSVPASGQTTTPTQDSSADWGGSDGGSGGTWDPNAPATPTPSAPSTTPTNPLDKFHPLVVTTLTGATGMDDAVQKQLVETLSQCLQTGLMASLADQVAGTGDGFPRHKMFVLHAATDTTPRMVGEADRGPLTGAMRMMTEADSAFDVAMQGDLGRALAASQQTAQGGGHWSMLIEGFMSDDQANYPSVEAKAIPPNLSLMWEVVKATILENLPVSSADMVNRAAATPVVAAADVQGGVTALYQGGARLYDALATRDNQFKFVPMYVRFLLDVNGPNITLQFQATVKPGEFTVTGPFATDQPIAPKQVVMKPTIYPDGRRPLMQVKLQRSWGPNVSIHYPVAIASFGTMVGTDVRDIKSCGEDCYQRLVAEPVIMVKLQPSVLLPKDATSSSASTFWPIFWENMRQAYGYDAAVAALKKVVVQMDQYQQNYVTMYIVLNQLVINFKDPTNPVIVPQLSSTPVVVKITTPGSGSQPITDHYITLGRSGQDETAPLLAAWGPNEFVDPLGTIFWRYTESNLIALSNDQIYKLYEKTVGPQVAQNLSGELKKQIPKAITEVDVNSSHQITTLMKPVLDLLQ